MPYYIVTDSSRKTHLVLAETQWAAIAKIPEAQNVRLAQPQERIKMQEAAQK